MNPPLPRLHAVTDDRVLALPDFDSRARAIARSPAVALHLRSKTASGIRLFELAQSLRGACTASGALLFVNDRADIARAVNADGIHLPAHGMPPGPVRKFAGPGVWIGCSTHSVAEAKDAGEHGADYVFLGPIWETASHPGRAPLGPDVIQAVDTANVIAIGGITADRIRTCLDAGAYGVAVVSALWSAPECDVAVQAMLLSLTDGTNDDGSR